MKIMLINFWRVIDSKGGTEKVFCDMANEFSKRGYGVTIVCCEKKNGVPFFPLNDNINFINLGYKIEQKSYLKKMKREFYRLFNKKICYEISELENERCIKLPLKLVLEKEKPDIIVSFQPMVTGVLKNALFISTPVITMLHFAPSQLLKKATTRTISAINKSECIQVLLPSFVHELKKYCSPKRIEVIPNVAPQFLKPVNLRKNKDVHKLITVGRMDEKQKKTHLLLDLFYKLKNDFPRWDLEIWGEIVKIEYHREMQHFVYKHNLEKRVHFKGTSNNILEVLKEADIFLFPSLYEGFPLSLIEAMSIGLPSVGFDYCSGVNELIKNNFNGFLCADLEDMINKTRLLMENDKLRIELGTNAHMDMKRYESRNIWDKWESLFNELNISMK